LFILFRAWQFPGLVRAWLDDPNWSHGFIIPLFSIYLIYTRWQDLLDARRRVCLLGLPIVIASILLIVAGFYPIGTAMVSQWGMVLLLFGLVLYLNGPAVTKLVWLPIFFLVFAIPIPDILYSRIAEPLQGLAATGSGVILKIIGVQGVTVNESHIAFRSVSGAACDLTVAEACAGMRMLTMFLALGVAMAYLGDRPIWQRLVLIIAAIPIAVFCNVLRVTITCGAFVLDHPEFGQDFMHTFTGILMLIPALLFLWLLGLLLQSLFVEVDDDDEPQSGEPSQGQKQEASA
jgi:exosortase